MRSGPNLRLVCFKGIDRMWRIAVELPQGCPRAADVQVSHDGQPLQPTGPDDNRWQLDRLSGSVKATEIRNAGQSWQWEIGPDECLLFKLLEDSAAEEGRLVRVASRGEYLVICPAGWETPRTSGIQLSPKRNAAVDGYVGYSFHADKDAHPRLEFKNLQRKSVAVHFSARLFTLEGRRAPAVFSECEAQLFLGSPPALRMPDPGSWSQVDEIVLGVAGKGRKKWEEGFKPNPTDSEVRLSGHLAGNWGGWFFARLYDANGLLMDSDHFAFASTLRGINTSGAPVLPGAGGHGEARLEFEHDSGTTIEAFSGGQRLEARAWNAGTVFTIPPSCEQVDWQIVRSGEAHLGCITRVDRVRWSLGSERPQPGNIDWTDKPVVATRADFAAASDKVLRIRLPCTNSLRELLAGFTRQTARIFRARAGQREVSVRLGEFAGSGQLDTVGAWAFSIWISQNGQDSCGAALRVKVDHECRFCAKRFGTDAEARKHAAAHESDFIQEVPYEQIGEQDYNLPAFYRCGAWYRRHTESDYVMVGDLVRCPRDVWTQVTAHSRFVGRAVRYINQNAAFSHLARPVTFARKLTGQPRCPAVRCSKCSTIFCNVRAEEVGEHVFRTHRGELFHFF